MKLVNKNEEPHGGYWYHFEDQHGTTYNVRGFSEGFPRLVSKVASTMRSNNIEVPPNLADLVEDQICQRQPVGKCLYEKKLGDRTAKAIHSFTKIADSAFAAIGIKTSITKKARGCSKCNKRRQALNNLTV